MPTVLIMPLAQNVSITADTLAADLSEGRTISVPLVWYPRLFHASPDERSNWRLIGRGEDIHWPDVDEDISISGLLAGRSSQERPESFGKWFAERKSCGSED